MKRGRVRGPCIGQAVCILVVEDEDLIRLLITEELVEAGFEVCEAQTGDRAAALIEAAPAIFCLLVTDIHMPGHLDGIAVARLLRSRYPSVPIIYTTGRPDVLDSMAPQGTRDAVLPKPYAPSDLLKTVKRMLAEGEKGLSA